MPVSTADPVVDPPTTLQGGASRTIHPRLRPFVSEMSGYSYDPGTVTAHRGMPSPSMTVVLAFGRPLDVGWHGRPQTQGAFWTVASGLAMAPAHIRQVGHQEGISLGLTPAGCRALFGVPASTLHGVLVSFDELLGRRAPQLYDDVSGGVGWAARFRALERHLLALAEATDGAAFPRPEVARAWTQLTRSEHAPQVSEVAQEVGWSRRHLGAQFRAEVGISPRDARRLGRFSRSHRLVKGGGHRLVDVAASSGYADQAHMTREWRDLSAYTPREWASAEFSFVQDLGH